ncbi:MAG: hypothetical protein ABI002_09880, partial [Saprospiraceae bacterium]
MKISFQSLQLSFSRMTNVRSSWIYVLLFAPLFAESQSADPQLLWLNRWLDYPNNYQIECKEAIHLNSKDLDFAPTFYNEKMVFISSRKGTILKDRQIGESFFDIYQSTIDSAGKGTVPNEFSTSLNSLYHEGPMSFTSAGDRVYFTRNNLEAGRKSKGKEKDRLKIMEAVKGPNDWIQIQESVLCNPTYSVCHPAISADGKIIVFASDMPGGKGGMDLYFAKWENEQWSAPINLGPSINTQGNEWFPVLTADNTLFFASNGLAGLGGLDLFTANFAGGYWKKVTNLGAPFNSNQDDLGFALNLDGKSGFFSSNRPGGTGKDDLYHFEISQIPLPAQITAALIAVDANSKIRLPGVSIYIIDKAFLKSGKEEISIKSDSTGRLDLVVQRKESLDIDKPNAITDINGNAETVFLSGHTYQLFASALGYQARSITIDTISRYIQLQMDKEPCLKGFGYITSRGNKKPIDGAEV